MAPPGKFNRDLFLKDNPGRFDYADDEHMIEGLRNTHPNYFTEDLPGPGATTQTPTDHVSTVAPSAGSKRTAAADSTDNIFGGKQKARGSGATPTNSEGVSSSQDIEMASLTGTGKEQADIGGNASTDMVYHIEKPLSLFTDRINTYKKTHKFMTFGLAPNIVTVTAGTVSR